MDREAGLAFMIALAAAPIAAAAPCPTPAELKQVRQACVTPGDLCDLLRQSIRNRCQAGGGPVVVPKITGACDPGAACISPVGRGALILPSQMNDAGLTGRLKLDRSELQSPAMKAIRSAPLAK